MGFKMGFYKGLEKREFRRKNRTNRVDSWFDREFRISQEGLKGRLGFLRFLRRIPFPKMDDRHSL
jgi:hypothetical protein